MHDTLSILSWFNKEQQGVLEILVTFTFKVEKVEAQSDFSY